MHMRDSWGHPMLSHPVPWYTGTGWTPGIEAQCVGLCWTSMLTDAVDFEQMMHLVFKWCRTGVCQLHSVLQLTKTPGSKRPAPFEYQLHNLLNAFSVFCSLQCSYEPLS